MIAALAAAAIAAFSQTPPAPAQEPPTTRLDDVVVEGRALIDLAETFVDEVAAPPANRGLARWPGHICVGVANLRDEVAQAVIDHISDVARAQGLRAGEPGCTPNVLIAFVEDGRAVADALVERRRRTFRISVSGMDRGSKALEDFRSADRPVRWWHISLPVVAVTHQAAIRLPGDEAAPLVPGEGIVNRGRPISDDLQKALIIVDIDAVQGVPLAHLNDYLAFVTLAQVDPEGQTAGYDTILNLFQPGGAEGLTDWDRAYLQALYGAPSERLDARDQAWWLARVTSRNRQAEAEGELAD